METRLMRRGPRPFAARGRFVRRGAAVVEMAVVTPLLLMMMFGIIEFGWVFMLHETITNAAREAARVGALQASTTTDVQNRFLEAMAPTGITVSPSMMTYTPASTDNPTVKVSIKVPYSQISLLGTYLGININKNIGATCTMRKEGQT